MPSRQQKNKNSFNLFLNSYFSVLVAAVVVIVLAFSYFLFLQPKFQITKIAIQNNINQQQKLYNQQQKKLNSLKLISQLYQKINIEDLQKFNQVLPNKYVKERLYGEIGEIVGDSGFILKSIKVNDEKDLNKKATTLVNKNIGVIRVELSLEAIDYSGFKNLLRTFEKNLRLMDIRQISFSPHKDSAQIILDTYYYQQK